MRFQPLEQTSEKTALNTLSKGPYQIRIGICVPDNTAEELQEANPRVTIHSSTQLGGYFSRRC